MTFTQLIEKIEGQAKTMVWWSPDQVQRGEDLLNNPAKGERAWSIPRATGEFLHDLIVKNNIKSVLELGTSIGYSTVWMAEALANHNGTIHTIERSENKISVAQENFADSGHANLISLHHGEILDILKNLPADLKFDLVFMDADRGHYHEYFPDIEKHLAQGATIIADNAISHAKRMQPFLDLLSEKGWHAEILGMDNGILIARSVIPAKAGIQALQSTE